ncbi:hypothetical protein C0991_011878 [Blastosporella zonata]|nr:hypothetical protein C0991_011878 [Blastosporella zonata]
MSAPRRSSLYTPSSNRPLTLVLQQPSVLERLISYLDWPALHALLSSSRESRCLFSEPPLRHIIIARFVPGYGACRRPATSQDSRLTIDLHHLHLFREFCVCVFHAPSKPNRLPVVSQSVPIHAYPTHALRSLFSLPYIGESEPLVDLSQSHSRFVLLLQSMVYSSNNLVIPPEPPHALLLEKLFPSVPELTSPAPLSYKAPPLSPSPHTSHSPLSKSKFKILSGSTRRLSKGIFKTPPPTPPPRPVAQSLALKSYSFAWRRSVPYRYPSEGIYSQSDSENDLAPPRRRYVASSTNSQSSLSRSSTPTPPTSNSSPSPPPSRKRFPLSPLSAPTPYDLIHALSPARAPVLRTYVPCAAHSQHPDTIIRCEEQLIDADLWTHLSVGDIVANLGHVPLSDEPESASPSDKTRRVSFQRSTSVSPPKGNWLIFNGTILVPFSSVRGAPVPVPDALTLPSPFYYTHILPRLTNPVFVLKRMPRFSVTFHGEVHGEPDEGDIAMRLVHLPTRVSTTHGGGVAVVRRYKWLARVFVDVPRDEDTEPELGLGWQGEWVLEGDGTKEGREVLVDYLLGRGRMQGKAVGKGKEREQAQNQVEWEWELVRERLLDVRTAGANLEAGGAEELLGL